MICAAFTFCLFKRLVEAKLVKLNEAFDISYVPDLIARKITGKEKGILETADLDFYRAEYERLILKLEDATEKTSLPENASAKDDLNDLLIRLRLNAFV